jgi:hypothetical protein
VDSQHHGHRAEGLHDGMPRTPTATRPQTPGHDESDCRDHLRNMNYFHFYSPHDYWGPQRWRAEHVVAVARPARHPPEPLTTWPCGKDAASRRWMRMGPPGRGITPGVPIVQTLVGDRPPTALASRSRAAVNLYRDNARQQIESGRLLPSPWECARPCPEMYPGRAKGRVIHSRRIHSTRG